MLRSASVRRASKPEEGALDPGRGQATAMNLAKSMSPPMPIHPSTQDRLMQTLDGCRQRIVAGEATAGVGSLISRLDMLWERSSMPEQDIIPICRAHAVDELLQQDPYTARARRKPRGYAGDAITLDYVYTQSAPPETSVVGTEIFRATTFSAAARSVVARRDLLGRVIDRAARLKARPRILSVECGHLREAERSAAVANGEIGELWAVDHDDASLAVVRRAYDDCVRTVCVSVGGILRRRVVLENFDLIYTAGLFDYLDDAAAKHLVRLLFDSLAPGGRLFVTNFTPWHHGRAYMACFMDWQLTVRDEAQLLALSEAVAEDELRRRATWQDAMGNVAYLEIVKR